jgi:hypothetical protein
MTWIMAGSVPNIELAIPNPIKPSGFDRIGGIADARDLISLACPSPSLKVDDSLFSRRIVVYDQVAYGLEVFRACYQISHIALWFGPENEVVVSTRTSWTQRKVITHQEYLSLPLRTIDWVPSG